MRSPTALKKSEQEPEGATKNPQNSFLKSISGRLGKILSFARKSELQESIEEILEGGSEAQTPLDAGEKAILKNVLEFKQLHVEDVMIPRADILPCRKIFSLKICNTNWWTKPTHAYLFIKATLMRYLGSSTLKMLPECFSTNNNSVSRK
jgi:Mg2+/Co2+ transporter CorC